MGARAGMQEAFVTGARVCEPKIEGRLRLPDAPNSTHVENFVMTRGAEAVWAEVNRGIRSARSSLLWISGPAGGGKTHLLSYVLALSVRAGVASPIAGRHLSLSIPETETAALLERRLVGRIAGQLTTSGRSDTLWRELPDGDALRLSLGQAKRQGVSSITVVVDCGLADEAAAADCEKTLLDLVKSVREPKLLVIAAARTIAHGPGVRVCELAPGTDEEAFIAITRARRMIESLRENSGENGKGSQAGDSPDAQIRPFHPLTAATMVRLAPAEARIAEVARVAYEALDQWHGDTSVAHLIWPSRLHRLPRIRELIAQRLGAEGEAALRIAMAAASAIDEPRRAIAQEIVELLALHSISNGNEPADLRELRQSLPAQHAGEEEFCSIAEELMRRSDAVLLFDRGPLQLRLNTHGANTPEIATFNTSLNLIRRFEPALMQVADRAELSAGLDRLRIALGEALENACRNRDTLTDLARQSATGLTKEQADALEAFIGSIEKGPAGVLVGEESRERQESIRRIIDEYDELAVLAEAAPRINGMREYLLGMRLHEIPLDDPNRDGALIKLETECKVILVEVNAAVHVRGPAQLDALEARFERFKWTYTSYYRAKHEEWRAELRAIDTIIEEGEKYRRALGRLETVPALRTGSELGGEFERLSRKVIRCGLQGRLAPEMTPLCPSCGFVLGASSPRDQLSEMVAGMKRRLEGKFAELSQEVIRRLIRHDAGNHRLEGFLKMTQAAQAVALIEMLDDELVKYLGELLEERGSGQGTVIAQLVRPLGGMRPRIERSRKTSPHKRQR